MKEMSIGSRILYRTVSDPVSAVCEGRVEEFSYGIGGRLAYIKLSGLWFDTEQLIRLAVLD